MTKKGFGNNRKKQLIFYSAILAFPVLQFAVFYVGVNFNSVLLAFKTYENGVFNFSGLNNFATLIDYFKNFTVFKRGFANSLVTFVVGSLAGTSFGLLFSFYIYKKAPFSGGIKVALFLPSIIPSIALIVMFKQFADGAVPAIISLLTDKEDVKGLLANPDTTFATIILYNVFIGFGTSTLLYSGAMSEISESVVEAAKLDGATGFTEFFKITLPMIWGTFSTFIVVAVGGIFVNQANVYAFFGAGAEENVVTIGYWLYKETVKVNGYAGYPVLAAFGIVLSVVTMILVGIVKRVLLKTGPTND